jgi:hypothetical protein
MLFSEVIHEAERRLIVASLLAARKGASTPTAQELDAVLDKVDRARELTAVVYADDEAALQLEDKAVALMKKYGRFLPGPANEFFRELAGFLNWVQLKKEM